MSTLRSVVAVLGTLGAALVSACADNPMKPPDARSVQLRVGAGVQPMCQLGCVDTDPNPGAPGIFLGSSYTPDYCFATGVTDIDGDGLRDYCETQLSWAFSPQLHYWAEDDVRREPYWVARKVDLNTVRIGYLLSYYRDLGAVDWTECRAALGLFALLGLVDIDEVCNPHNGDSEAIFIDVYYDELSEHWVLGEAWFSQHEHYGHYARGAGPYPLGLQYPANRGGYPSVYVAMKKHANYGSVSECNRGGPEVFGVGEIPTDDCSLVRNWTRLEWSNYWNRGSSTTHTAQQDCVVSRNPAYEYYGQGRQECYWTPRYFRGWVPDNIGGGEAKTGYSARVQGFGF